MILSGFLVINVNSRQQKEILYQDIKSQHMKVLGFLVVSVFIRQLEKII